MENLPIILFSILTTILVLCLTYLAAKLARLKPSQPAPGKPVPPRNPKEGATYQLNVKVGENNRWRVENADGSHGPLYVRKGDRIVWKIEGTDAFFQFPRSDHFFLDSKTDGAKQPDPWLIEIGPDGGQVSVVIAERACPGAYAYSVFCNVSKKSNIPVTGYAEGGSPPEFIIMI
ncbi:MAG: hypothetical protein AAF564_23840 [Bacteroidota bacterium]